MTLPANTSVYISAALFVLGAYVAALYIGLLVWTFRDAHARSRDMLAQILATLLVALFTIPGLIVYLLLRPHTTLAEEYERNLAEEAILQELEDRRICPDCQHRVDPDFVVCPYCHYQLRLRCVGCGRLLNPQWEVCPYCGLYREQPGESKEIVETGAEEPGGEIVESIEEPQPAEEASIEPEPFYIAEPGPEMPESVEAKEDDEIDEAEAAEAIQEEGPQAAEWPKATEAEEPETAEPMVQVVEPQAVEAAEAETTGAVEPEAAEAVETAMPADTLEATQQGDQDTRSPEDETAEE